MSHAPESAAVPVPLTRREMLLTALMIPLLVTLAVLLALVMLMLGSTDAARPLFLPATGESAAYTRKYSAIAATIESEQAPLSQTQITEKLVELSERSEKLTEFSTPQLQQMVAVIERGLAIDHLPHAPVPQQSGDPQEFDVQTASIYDIQRRTTGENQIVFDWIIVDAAGRTLVHTVPAQMMSRAELATHQVFEMARKNPHLRQLLDSVRKLALHRTAELATQTPVQESSVVTESTSPGQ